MTIESALTSAELRRRIEWSKEASKHSFSPVDEPYIIELQKELEKRKEN